MQQKPGRWNVSPALITPEAMRLWEGVAFAAPLWRGIGKGALLNALGQPLQGANLVVGSTFEWRSTPYGLGVGVSGASSCLMQTTGIGPIVTSDGAGTGDFSMVCLANPKAEARVSCLGGQRRADSPNNYALLLLNSGPGGEVVSGQFSFSTYNGATYGTNVPGVIDANDHMFGGVRSNGEMRAYVDGILRATGSGAVQNILSENHGFAIGNLPPGDTHYVDTACSIVLAIGWNRALSDAEMALLARDPFIMFRPVVEWQGVWAPVSDLVLDPANLVNVFGFETPDFTQTHALTAADAFLAPGFETPVFVHELALTAVDSFLALGFETPAFTQAHALTATDGILAESFETPILLQNHYFGAAGMDMPAALDTAFLNIDVQVAPGFRTRGIGARAPGNDIARNDRIAQVNVDS